MVLETLVECGAPNRILSEAKPHLGTDILHSVLINIRRKLAAAGVQIRSQSPILKNINDNADLWAENWKELMKVDTEAFKKTCADAEAYLAKFGEKLPIKMTEELKALKDRLSKV